MKTQLKDIKKAILSNNCPECFSNNSLLLTFHQKQIENAWFKKVTSEISESLVCNKCATTIYPVRYTKDIERVREFYYKTLENPKTSFRLKKLSYLIIILITLMTVSLVIYFNLPVNPMEEMSVS